MHSNIETLKNWIAESNNIVFFGGAGVSTESGIPDFRSVDGLYHQKFDYPPETIICHSFYLKNPEPTFSGSTGKRCCPWVLRQISPTGGWHSWSRRASCWPSSRRISTGCIKRPGAGAFTSSTAAFCEIIAPAVSKFFSAEFVKNAPGVPRCPCGGIVKPDVVLYEESLDEDCITKAVQAIQAADLLIVGGTSLTVYPAAGLIRYYTGQRLVLINRDETPYDDYANLVLHESLGDVFSQV